MSYEVVPSVIKSWPLGQYAADRHWLPAKMSYDA